MENKMSGFINPSYKQIIESEMDKIDAILQIKPSTIKEFIDRQQLINEKSELRTKYSRL